MTAEEYVKAIVKKVKCSSSKKKEIRQQLLSDISSELEQGENIEEVIARMGTVSEMANEFNENISAAEKRKYSSGIILKIVVGILLLLAIIFALIWWYLPKNYEFGKSGKFEQTSVETRVEDIIDAVSREDFEYLKANASEMFLNAVPIEQLSDIKDMLGTDWGALTDIGSVYLIEIKQMGNLYVVAEINVTYENVKVIYQITLDENLMMAGIYMR